MAIVLVVLYAGLCKMLLFRNLEYPGSDLYSFLEMSWSWLYAGRLLHDNVYGCAYAIHNFYLLLAFAPLTISFGAYGLILGLVLLNGVAALRVAFSAAIDAPGRLAVLVGLLSPLTYYVFDHPDWGFHPELCYLPLGLLLALDLGEDRVKRAMVVAALMVLVKEDGAVLCAAVLTANFAWRFWRVRNGPPERRRRVIVAAFLSLLAVTIIFAAGMAILSLAGRHLAGTQQTSDARVAGSLGVMRALTGEDRSGKRLMLRDGLVTYFLAATLILLPLARRMGRAVVLLLLSSPPLLVVLTISSALYGFWLLLWPPRLATFLGLALACGVFACLTPDSRVAVARPLSTFAVVAALGVVSWGLQLALLARHGYTPWPRLNVHAMAKERGYSVSALPQEEVRLVRCLAGRLPRGLPVFSAPNTHPVFHRQSIVFEGFEAHAWHSPRLRVVRASKAPPTPEGGTCTGPRVGDLVVVVDCDLKPLIADCGRSDRGVADPGSGGRLLPPGQ